MGLYDFLTSIHSEDSHWNDLYDIYNYKPANVAKQQIENHNHP